MVQGAGRFRGEGKRGVLGYPRQELPKGCNGSPFDKFLENSENSLLNMRFTNSIVYLVYL
jgi:hypothetical protein